MLTTQKFLLPRRRATLDELSKLGPVDLPDIPSLPVELEHAAGALFQAARYFVELNVVQRDPDEVLELDVVATSYDGSVPTRVLAEAKTGKWGYSNVFKLLGWMTYLGIPKGVMFATKAPRQGNLAQLKERMAPFNIAVIKLDSPALGDAFAQAGFPNVVDAKAVEVWRYVYAVQGAMLDYVRQLAKERSDLKAPKELLRYQQVIDYEVFFEADPRECLFRLYEAFKAHPKLALGAAREIEGKGFDCDTVDPSNPTVRAAMFNGDYDLIQACFYFEHKARLAILKAAIDISLFEVDPKPVLKHKDHILLTQDDFLPATFRSGLEVLQTHPYFKRYAVFWQVFLWGFGGFYLADRQEEEFTHLSEQTGVPVDEIPNALKAFDLLFPLSTGSWITATNTQCVVAKMVPMALRGMGAYHRQLRYGFKSFADLKSSDYTAEDMRRWYNKAYEVLKLREVGAAGSAIGT